MPQSVELPDDLAAALIHEASSRGMSLADYTLYLLSSACPATPPIRNGADLVAFWEREGLLGTRMDIADSQVEARKLREQAQNRRH